MKAMRVAAAILVIATTLSGLSISAAGTVGASAQGVVVGHTAAIDPVLQRQLAVAGPGDIVSVVAVLTDQVDVRSLGGTTKHQRVTRVVGALRARATARQVGLLALLARLKVAGLVTSYHPLWIVNAVELSGTRAALLLVAARPDVAELQADAVVVAPQARTPSATAATTSPEAELAKVNVPALWNLGLHGEGIVVANMDTGVDVTHPDLASSWRGGSNSWFDPNGQHKTPVDVNGHGTWTMGVMVGGGSGGTTIGAAPAATWIAVKIFSDAGTTTTSTIHRGFQWLLDPDGNAATDDAPDVVNDSWTMSAAGCNLDFQLDLRSLRAAGILPVFAAGNYGPAQSTVLSPANLPEAFAVGATNSDDVVDNASSRGPSACGANLVPAVVAPGDNINTTDLYGSYAVESGTSMAAPLAAGVLALLLQASPGLSADSQQGALDGSAIDLGPAGPDPTYGYGRLDAYAAYQRMGTSPDISVTLSPGSATVTPGGAATYTVSVTPLNGFTSDVALSLTGLTSSQAAWSFSPAVIPGGSGTATLTVSTSGSISPSTYPLSVAGSSGTTSRSATGSLTVSPPPDFGLALTPAAQTVTAGGTASSTARITALNGFGGTAVLSVSGLPANVGSTTVSPTQVAGGGTAQVTATTSPTAPAGSYPITVTANAGGMTHTATFTVTVAPPDWTIAVSPSSISISRRQTASYTVTLTAAAGAPGPVTLSVTGLPSGATGSLSRNPFAPPGSATLTVRTTSTTARGTFNLRVTGSDGARSHAVVVTLTVR